MPLDMQSRLSAMEGYQAEVEFGFDSDLDRPWVENAVTLTVAVLTALFVSSVAVLMYLA
jgi:hypothetical protein